MKCKNCRWLADPAMSSVCVNNDSKRYWDFVLPNDSNLNLVKNGVMYDN